MHDRANRHAAGLGFRHVRRDLAVGESIPQPPSLFAQVAACQGCMCHADEDLQDDEVEARGEDFAEEDEAALAW